MTELPAVTGHDNQILAAMDDRKAPALSCGMLDALDAGLDTAAAAGKVAIISGRPGVESSAGRSSAWCFHPGAGCMRKAISVEG